jgi:hypothetical protein
MVVTIKRVGEPRFRASRRYLALPFLKVAKKMFSREKGV